MEIELPRDFKEFLKLLNEEKVDYLLIGGYAVGYYGYPLPELNFKSAIKGKSLIVLRGSLYHSSALKFSK